MSIRNRELSQFGSFIFIDDASRSIAITTSSDPYVGIGTTSPQYKLDVYGNTNIDGDLTLTGNLSYGGQLSFGGTVDLNTSGIITAAAFYNTNQELLTNFDSWTTSNNNIYRLNGNVGIGTTNPISKFTIEGNSYQLGNPFILGNSFIEGNCYVSGITTSYQFQSFSTDEPPFIVNSTALVQNLNASLFQGRTPPSGDIVGTTDTQILTNKTLIQPIISSINTGFGTVFFPQSGTLLTTDSLSIINSSMIQNGSILNEDISASAGISYTKLNLSNSITNNDISNTANISVSKLSSRTISGIELGNNLRDLTAGTHVVFGSGTSYNGSTTNTISVNATSANTLDRIVVRDGSTGGFSAGNVNVSNLTASFNINGNNISASNNVTVTNNVSVGNSISVTNNITSGGSISIGSNVTAGGNVTATSRITGNTILATGIMGVGSTNSSYKFNVDGDINFTGNLYQNGNLFVSSGGGGGTGESYWVKSIAGIHTSDNVGIKTQLPLYPLHVIGETFIDGNIISKNITSDTVTTTSDKRLKENIQTISNALEIVMQLRGVEYTRIDDENSIKQIGLIAQEVESVVPEVVFGEDIKSVAYGNIVGILIEAIKNQQNQINELKKILRNNNIIS